MNKKTLIELFIYVIVVVISVTLLVTGKSDDKATQIKSDFKFDMKKGDKQ